ncbi:hypothetical protein [Virgibacillus necropolis]
MKKNQKERTTDIIILSTIGTVISAASTFILRSSVKNVEKKK